MKCGSKSFSRKRQVAENKPSVVTIDYEKLAAAIVKAQEESYKIKCEKEKLDYNNILQKRKEVLCEKDFSHVNCRLLRKTKAMLNEISVCFRLLFISKKNAQYFAGITPLTKLLVTGLLSIIQLAFYFLSIACGYGIWKSWGSGSEIVCFSGLVLFFTIAQFIRIAKFEIENIEDKAFLMNTAVMVMTIFSLIFAAASVAISLLGKGMQ